MGLIGMLLIISGGLRLKTYLQRRRWPVVDGTLDDVDVKIEGTVPYEGVGVFVRPKYLQKIKYYYRGRPYITELTEYEMKEERLKLRVNPEKPFEAYLDNKTLLFPVLAISVGIIIIMVLIKLNINGNTGNE